MNKFRKLLAPGLLAAICLCVSGCYSPPHAKDTYPRFKDAKSVNVAIRFYQWNSLCIIQPEYRDDGFLRFVKPDGLAIAFDNLHVQRDTAVVLMGWNYDPRDIAKFFEEWKTILAGHGFRRVVCLRDNDSTKFNGLPILHDWQNGEPAPSQTAAIRPAQGWAH